MKQKEAEVFVWLSVAALMFGVMFFMAGCSSVQPKQGEGPWTTIVDSNGRVVAEVNNQSGEVSYFQSPKVAFEEMYKIFVTKVTAMEKQLEALQPKPQEKKPKEKK